MNSEAKTVRKVYEKASANHQASRNKPQKKKQQQQQQQQQQ
ncbi:hypothetical protein [Synechococcus sp. HIMB2401]